MTQLKIAAVALVAMALGIEGARSLGLGQPAEAGQEAAVATKPAANGRAEPKRKPAAAPGPVADQPEESWRPVQYLIRGRVFYADREDGLGSNVTVVAGQAARYHLGEQTIPISNIEPIPLGLNITVTAVPMMDGRVNLCVRTDWFERDEGEGLRIRGESLIVDKIVEQGEALDLEFKPSESGSKDKPTRLSINVVYPWET